MSNDQDPPLAGGGPVEDPPMGSTSLNARSTHDVVDAALRMVTALTEATMNNADGVSITLERHGQLMTVAASNDAILEMDRHQYESGEGPCLAAKAQGQWYYIESLDEETRWPTFVPLALEQGIHSVLSSPLMTADRPQGALNIYSNTAHAFTEREQELAALFATQASLVLTTAGQEGTEEQLNARFRAALETRQLIARAEGVIMERHDVRGAVAATMLRELARDGAKSVGQYARELLESIGNEPSSEA
jgi:GAF domain-containing protein